MSEVWDRARRLQDETNAKIDLRCLSVSPDEYASVAKATAAEFLDPEEWEWILRSRADLPPAVFIMRYLKHQPKGE